MSAANQEIPYKVRRARSKFMSKRAEYYNYLASMLKASKGETKLLTIFEREAVRREKDPIGILSAYWAEQYANNGSNLEKAWSGTLPDDEVAIIAVAQNAGRNALEAALHDMARIAALSDRVKREVWGTLAAAVIGITIAIVMITAFPVGASAKLREVYSNIPLTAWGPRGQFMNAWAAGVEDYGFFFLFGFILIVTYVYWSVNNLVGPVRDWLDRNVILYSTVRDVKGALFLATMSTLTRRRGNTMYTLRDALSNFAAGARSAWLRWRVEEIVDRIDANGATDGTAFETNLLSKEMYYFLQDTQESQGFAEGFEQTGQYVEKTVLSKVIGRMTIYRWALLLTGVACVVGVMGMQFSVIYEMKGVMLNYYNSR